MFSHLQILMVVSPVLIICHSLWRVLLRLTMDPSTRYLPPPTTEIGNRHRTWNLNRRDWLDHDLLDIVENVVKTLRWVIHSSIGHHHSVVAVFTNEERPYQLQDALNLLTQVQKKTYQDTIRGIGLDMLLPEESRRNSLHTWKNGSVTIISTCLQPPQI